MATRIPTLERTQPVQPTSVGRIETGVPDLAGPQAQVGRAVEGLATTAIRVVDRYRKDAVSDKTYEGVEKYNGWYKENVHGNSEKGIIGLRNLQGNPDEAYSSFDEKAEEFRNNLIAESNLDDAGKEHLKKALSRAHNGLYSQRLTYYGQQVAVYQERLKTNAVKIAQQNAVDGIGLYDGKDPATLAPFTTALEDIRDTHLRHGLKNGTTTEVEEGGFLIEDEDGQQIRVMPGKIVQQQIAKDMSDAVYNTVNNTIAADRLDLAQPLLKDFDHIIDPVNKAKLTKAFKDAEFEKRSYALLGRVDAAKSSEARATIINSIRDPKMRTEVRKLQDANRRYKENTIKRDSKASYDTIAIAIQNYQNSNKPPIDSVFQLKEAIPEYKAFINRVTDSKQRDALHSMIESPKNSDPQALDDALALIPNNGLFGISPQDLRLATAKLNDKHTTLLTSEWRKQNTETDAAKRAASDSGRAFLKRFLDANDVLDKDKNGRLTKEGLQKRNEIQIEFEEALTRVHKPTPEEAMNQAKEIANPHIIEKKNQEISIFQRGVLGDLAEKFGWWEKKEPQIVPAPSPIERIRGRGQQAPVPGAPTPSIMFQEKKKPYNQLSTEEVSRLFDEFAKDNDGRQPKDSTELRQWYESQGG